MVAEPHQVLNSQLPESLKPVSMVAGPHQVLSSQLPESLALSIGVHEQRRQIQAALIVECEAVARHRQHCPAAASLALLYQRRWDKSAHNSDSILPCHDTLRASVHAQPMPHLSRMQAQKLGHSELVREA
eukprot:7323446-Pyramimonas_sp.AAC.1